MKSTQHTHENQSVENNSSRINYDNVALFFIALSGLSSLLTRQPVRTLSMVKNTLKNQKVNMGFAGALSRKRPDFSSFFMDTAKVSKDPIKLLMQENPWVKNVIVNADKEVKENKLLVIFPSSSIDMTSINQHTGSTSEGAVLLNPSLKTKTSIYHFAFVADKISTYKFFMYLANPTPAVLAHESAHIWSFTQLIDDKENDTFIKTINASVKNDLEKLTQMNGDENFEKNKKRLIEMLKFERYHPSIHSDKLILAHEQFAHIVHLSLNSEIGFENIKLLLPETANYITSLFNEKEMLYKPSDKLTIEVEEEISRASLKNK